MEIAVELLHPDAKDAVIVMPLPAHLPALEALCHHELAASFYQPATDGKPCVL